MLIEHRHDRGRVDLFDMHDLDRKIGGNGVLIDQEPVPLFGEVFRIRLIEQSQVSVYVLRLQRRQLGRDQSMHDRFCRFCGFFL